MSVFRVKRLIEFCDTDMAGIVHFSNFFRFMEAAEHAYLRGCGFNVFTTWHGETITFPRVSASCDYLKPVRFQDELDIEVRIDRIGTSSVRYAFTFMLRSELIARGQITVVLCKVRDKALESFALPDEMRAKLINGPGESA